MHDASSPGAGAGGVRSRTHHELDRAAARLRERFAARPARRALAEPAWRWGDERPRGCEASIRELLADIARGSAGASRLEQRAHSTLERTAKLLAFDGDVSPVDTDRGGSPAGRCEWCTGPLPPGLRPEARYCTKSCRQKASRDHQALVERLVREFGDGWALSTSAAGLQDVLALCPSGMRVCSWHRAVRPTRSRRAISAWEPLIVCGGRELPTDRAQTVRDALAYGGRYRTFPGAMTGMKPPQFAVWMFQLLGARPGDQLVDLYPGSGAIGEAWRRYAGTPAGGGQCPRCFGHGEPCAACVAAAGDPDPADFRLARGVEQVRRCRCGRVYGAYHAGSVVCFLMQPPGRRQVQRCVRCGERLIAHSTSDCTAECRAGVDAPHVAAAAETAPPAPVRSRRGVSRAGGDVPRERRAV
jgi:hypothetical protein